MKLQAAPHTWLFDLDNTLHDASFHIFPHINRAMTGYIAEQLVLPAHDANRLRVDYWRRYGATLHGMVRHHGTDPGHFLRSTHPGAELRHMVVYERALATMLRALPGRKIIFSNGPQDYVEAVLGELGVRQHFAAVSAIEHTDYHAKPSLPAFRQLLARFRLDPRRCILIEDSAANLRTAKRLGMRTVLVGPLPRRPAWVDHQLPSVLALRRQHRRISAPR